MVHRINSTDSARINSIEKQHTKQKPKIDRQFGAFIDEALQKTNTSKEINISSHAQKRLDERGFSLNEHDWTKIGEAVQTLEDKGSKNSLILYDDLALIASIQNRTVITALRSDEMSDVTNIDSAIKV